jgi:hypothetical protein
MNATYFKQVLTVFLLAAIAFAARADLIVSNLGQPTSDYYGPIGDANSTSNFLIGQEFTLPPNSTPFLLTNITLLLSPTGGGAKITVSIWSADANDDPLDQLATVATQTVTTAGAISFLPATNIALAPGIYYVVAAPASPTNSGLVKWAYSGTTNWAGPGTLGGYADTSAGFWRSTSITNFPQQISIEAVPESSALILQHAAGTNRLAWPPNLNGFVLETTTNLAPPDWQPITNAPAIVAGTNTLAVRTTNTAQLFRLRQTYAAENLDQPNAYRDGPIGNANNHNNFLIGQEFTVPPGNFTLNRLTLLLNPVNGSGNITVSLWNVGPDNNPTNQFAVVASALVSHETNVDFVPTNTITLPGGTYYAVASPTAARESGLVYWDWTAAVTWTGFGELNSIASTYTGQWVNSPFGVGPFQIAIRLTPAP